MERLYNFLHRFRHCLGGGGVWEFPASGITRFEKGGSLGFTGVGLGHGCFALGFEGWGIPEVAGEVAGSMLAWSRHMYAHQLQEIQLRTGPDNHE